MFEANDYIGGRSTTVNAYNDPSVPVELGGSIFVEINYNLYNATKELGLEFSDLSTASELEGAEELGIYNGKEMVFTISNDWKTIPKVIWRYGPLAPRRAQKLTQSTVGKFLNIYNAPVFPFDSLTEAVEELGLLDATGHTGEQYLAANGISGKFVTEVIQASTRVNYGQNIGLIHGLETLVCQSTSGAVAVSGGNWQIFASMLSTADTEMHLSTRVTSLSRTSAGKWKLHLHHASSSPSKQTTRVFDDVIVASPWQFTDLSVSPALDKTPDTIPYAPVHVTFFASPLKLDPVHFGLSADTPVPQYVLTTLLPSEQANRSITQGESTAAVGSVGFFSVSIVRTATRPNPIGSGTRTEYIYKVFSPAEFPDHGIQEMLGIGEELWGAVTWVKRHRWDAYPYEYPRVTFEELRLAEGLWYTGGMDSFISTMETNSLMGRNVASLLVRKWEREVEKRVEAEREKEEQEARRRRQKERERAGMKGDDEEEEKAGKEL